MVSWNCFALCIDTMAIKVLSRMAYLNLLELDIMWRGLHTKVSVLRKAHGMENMQLRWTQLQLFSIKVQLSCLRIISLNAKKMEYMFYAPTTKKVKNMDEVNHYFENVAQRFGFKYLNYTENYDLCNSTANFCVSVHLNPKATDRFTTDFAHDLYSIGVLF